MRYDLPTVEGLPDLPDDAFASVAEGMDHFQRVLPGTDDANGDASDTFLRSVGLRGRGDPRAWALAGAFACPEAEGDYSDLKPKQNRRFEAMWIGITLGLQLAQRSGWTPPIAEGGDD
jgi:hypothetical protein